MGYNSGAYNLVLVLHVLSVIVGFGGFALAGGLTGKARMGGGAGGQAVAEVSFDFTEHVAQWFIYAVPILGIALILMSDDAWKFSQAWISISFLLYIAFLGLMHGLHMPTLRRMNELGATLAGGPTGAGAGVPPQAAELDALGKKVAMTGGALNLIWVVILVLMVFKPGL